MNFVVIQEYNWIVSLKAINIRVTQSRLVQFCFNLYKFLFTVVFVTFRIGEKTIWFSTFFAIVGSYAAIACLPAIVLLAKLLKVYMYLCMYLYVCMYCSNLILICCNTYIIMIYIDNILIYTHYILSNSYFIFSSTISTYCYLFIIINIFSSLKITNGVSRLSGSVLPVSWNA